MAPHLALNTSASFITNTNFQFYGGETTMSYLTQMAGLAVQNWLSPAVGLAVLVAVIRGFARRSTSGLGNFWVDLYRGIVYILAPIAVVFAVFLIWQGVPQTFSGHATATTLEGAAQIIARGPVATQEAIKMIGTNGGGFYNSNSAVPFENPNGLTNFIELIAILLIPMAEVFMFGKMIFNRRHGFAVFSAMFVLFVIGIAIILPSEQHGSAILRSSGVNLVAGHGQSGGNMQDKEVRFGIATSALWADAATVTGNGSVNSGLEAFTPYGGGVPLVNIFAGEVIFGGVGSGLYGMFFAIIIAVFVAGLMVGRTPEYLGKKIEAREIKLAALGALFLPTLDLSLTAIAVVTKSNLKAIYDPGAHGFTEALYAWTSQTFNNGSAFAGYTVNNFLAEAGAVAMLMGRYVPIAAALAIGGSLAAKKTASGLGGDVPHRRPDVRRPRHRRHRAHRRPDDPAGPVPRPDRRGAEPLMRAPAPARAPRRRDRRRRPDRGLRPGLPGADDRLRPGRLPEPGEREPDHGRRQGGRLEARRPGVHEPPLLPRAPVGDLARLQRGRDDLLEPRPDRPGPADPGQRSRSRRS